MSLFKLIALPIALCFLVGCSSAQKEWDDETIKELRKTVTRTKKPLTLSQFRFLHSEGLAPEELKELKKAYHQFFSLYESLDYDYRDINGVKQFLSQYIATPPLEIQSNTFDGNNTQAVAYALLAATVLDLDHIHTEKYRKALSSKLSISDTQIMHGIYYALKHSTNDIMSWQHSQLLSYTAKSPTDFAQSILLPYLTSVSTNIQFPQSTHDRVSQQFNTHFEVSDDSTPLRDFVEAFYGYIDGESLHSKHLRQINTLMKPHKRYLRVREDHAALYTIDETSFPIADSTIEKIQILSETPLSRRRGALLGVAVYKEQVVNLFANSILDETEDVIKAMVGDNTDERLLTYLSFWNSNTNYTAQGLLKKFYHFDFGNKTKTEITQMLTYNVALHESKHAWDDSFEHTITRPWMFDLEVSAHLAEIIYGTSPHYSALFFMRRLQNQAKNSKLRPQVHAVNSALWELLAQRIYTTITTEEFRQGVREIYDAYRDRAGVELPLLDDYKTTIVVDIDKGVSL